jgi:hypothetical protein
VKALQWTLPGKRKPVRPKGTWIRAVDQDREKLNKTLHTCKLKWEAQDRAGCEICCGIPSSEAGVSATDHYVGWHRLIRCFSPFLRMVLKCNNGSSLFCFFCRAGCHKVRQSALTKPVENTEQSPACTNIITGQMQKTIQTVCPLNWRELCHAIT